MEISIDTSVVRIYATFVQKKFKQRMDSTDSFAINLMNLPSPFLANECYMEISRLFLAEDVINNLIVA